MTVLQNVGLHPVPLEAGPVLGSGERAVVETVGPDDQHYIDLGRLAVMPDVEPAEPQAEDEPAKPHRARKSHSPSTPAEDEGATS